MPLSKTCLDCGESFWSFKGDDKNFRCTECAEHKRKEQEKLSKYKIEKEQEDDKHARELRELELKAKQQIEVQTRKTKTEEEKTKQMQVKLAMKPFDIEELEKKTRFQLQATTLEVKKVEVETQQELALAKRIKAEKERDSAVTPQLLDKYIDLTRELNKSSGATQGVIRSLLGSDSAMPSSEKKNYYKKEHDYLSHK